MRRTLIAAVGLLALVACGEDDADAPDTVVDVGATAGGGSGEVHVSWPAPSSETTFELLRADGDEDEIVALTVTVDAAEVLAQDAIDGAFFQVFVVDDSVAVIERVAPDGLGCAEPCALTYRVVVVGSDGRRSEPSSAACASPPTVDEDPCA